ncbi:AAA family ATPase [Rahnella sp. GSA61A]|uniref:AAA family ATPase n=1 Tax=Rahnella sp. GSA61A TaxID=2862678 RepID=UPI001CBDA466|nr:AAA family ATPase [Rahnella sp. GSA61A]
MKPISISKENLLHAFDKQNNTYCVITGKNGDGKSRLLSSFARAGFKSDRWQSVIAVATTPFDSFPKKIPDSKFKSIYKYIGVQGYSTNSSAKQLIETATMSLFTDRNEGSLIRLDSVLDFLNFDPFFELIFKISPNLVFDDINKTYYLNDPKNEIYFNDEKLTFTGKKSYSLLKELYYFFRSLTDKNGLVKITYNLYNNTFSHKDILLPDSIISTIYKVNQSEAFTIMDLRLKKKTENEAFSLRRASSGEQCVLLSMIGIASTITDDALVLIDEPEISLHPYWQEQYIGLLNKLFGSFNGCAFFIATHSPLIVSKLNNKNSYIYDIKSELLTPAFYFNNKSSDYQLAKVFELPGDKNEYLTRILISFLIRKTTLADIEPHKINEVKSVLKLKNKISINDPVFRLIELVELAIGVDHE